MVYLHNDTETSEQCCVANTARVLRTVKENFITPVIKPMFLFTCSLVQLLLSNYQDIYAFCQNQAALNVAFYRFSFSFFLSVTSSRAAFNGNKAYHLFTERNHEKKDNNNNNKEN